MLMMEVLNMKFADKSFFMFLEYMYEWTTIIEFSQVYSSVLKLQLYDNVCELLE